MLIQKGIVAVPGAVYAEKNHTKISCEYNAKRGWS